MNLIDYGRILVRRGWLVVLLALIAAGSAYFLSAQQPPTYRATQRVLVQPTRADLGLTESATRLLNQYAAYLNSELIAAEVINNLNLDMTPGQLKGDVTIAPITISLEIQIDVDMADIETAGRVAREWGMMLVRFRERENQEARREDRIDATLQDNPAISLLGPRPAINAAAGAVLGVLLGGVLVFVLEYLESNIVRRREDVERALDLPVLAAIPNVEA
jgi:capsular polysaccharide biosynthesis protein